MPKYSRGYTCSFELPILILVVQEAVSSAPKRISSVVIKNKLDYYFRVLYSRVVLTILTDQKFVWLILKVH